MADSMLSLVTKIHEGTGSTRHPAFFVWDEEQTYEFLDSLFLGYLIGLFPF